MAIDPSIALAVRPVDITAQYATPFQTLGQALSLQNMMRQGQLQSLELQQQQAMWQERQALAQLLSGGQAYQQPQAQTAPSVTPGGATAAPLPALTGQTPTVSAGPAPVGQPPTVAPLAGGAAPTMADLMNLPIIDRGAQMASLAPAPDGLLPLPPPATALPPADAQTQNYGWPTQSAPVMPQIGAPTQFNTPIPPNRQAEYQAWLSNLPAQLRNSRDYDLQGAFMSGAKPSENQHLTDQFKKPNHMTFSDQSQYSGQGGVVGGKWSQDPDGSWTFYASPTNLQYHSAQELQDYFRQYEPGNKLVLPGQTGSSPATTRPTGAIQNAPALPIPDFQAMIKATPMSGLGMQMAENYNKYLKAHYDTLNAQLTNQQNTGKRVAQLAGSIVDEPTKMTAIGQAMAEHLISQDEARRLMTVSPTDPIWQSWENQGKTASEVAADNLAQSKFHLEQVQKAFDFAKAPYDIATARSTATTKGLEADQAQRTQDAQMLAAAARQGPDAVAKVKAQIAAQDPTGQRLAVFGNATTPKDFAARAQTPQETVSTAITEQQNKITNVREAIKAGQENQKFNMQYGPGSVDALVEQVYHHPDTAVQNVPEAQRTAVMQRLQEKYGIAFPKPLGNPEQEIASRSTLNAINYIRTALDDPEIQKQIGPIMGKFYDEASKWGTAVNLSPAAAQKAQELRTQMKLLLTQEPREFGGRLSPGLIDELQKSGPRPGVNIDLLKGALNGTERTTVNQLDNLDKERFGGQMRPRDVRGLEPSTDVRTAILGQKKGPGMYQMTDGSSWYLTSDGQIIPR